MPEVERELARRLEAGQEVVLATVVRIDGAPPSRPGAKVLMTSGAILAGTLGCSEFDAAALADAPDVMASASPALRTYRHDLGSIEAYLEPYAGRPLLLVGAATPVAGELLRCAPSLGFRTMLVEFRPERLQGAAWEAGQVVTEMEQLRDLLSGELYAVLTDHDAPDLVDLLTRLLAAGPRFVGLMGSRRHTGHHLDALAARGMSAEAIAKIQSPVGLDIAAQTPAEIALSILAGLVAVRRGGGGGWMRVTRS